MARNVFGSLFLRIGDFLCFAGSLIFAISTDLLFCWEFIFAIFRKYQSPALTIFSFLLSTCNRNAYFQTILGQYYGLRQYFIVYRFVSERQRQVVIEQTRFLSAVFLCCKFKSDNITLSKFLRENVLP